MCSKEKSIPDQERRILKNKNKQLIDILLHNRNQKISIYDRYFTDKMNKEQREDLQNNINKDRLEENYEEPPYIEPSKFKKRGRPKYGFEPRKQFYRDETYKYL